MKDNEMRQQGMLCPMPNGFRIGEVVFCNGQQCMMWRWVASKRKISNGISDSFLMEDIPVDERHGYCGLAGKP